MEGRRFEEDLRRLREAFESYVPPGARPVLLLLAGPPGVGKSHLAGELARRAPFAVVETDRMRKALFPKPSYSPQESLWVHRLAQALARLLLREGRSVISDATNILRIHRQALYRVADRATAPCGVVVLRAPEAVVRERLGRSERGYSDADWEVYRKMRRNWEPVSEERPHIAVTSDQVEAVLDFVERLRAPAPGGAG